jgi:isopenicillin N synthase-like dioxygenase
LRDAARETGFFYLTGHGIDPELQQVQQLSRAFFALPLAAKQQVAMIHSPIFVATTDRGRS